MGACLSIGAPAHIVEKSDGGDDEYHQRYLEDQVLGEGEFGVVKMVHDVTKGQEEHAPLACKTLRKGAVFKDNTLYSPIKPEVLRHEIEILRALSGQHNYCLQLYSVFETPRVLYVVTEFCAGGELMEWVAAQPEDLRTEDVSRIAFQLLSAVHHCASHKVIHRDIKPENIMFQDPAPTSELRLIDFGSGTIDLDKEKDDDIHTTFAGSAFYISPEMFQHTYTSKTDVWSAGVTLYVLVAGYPADQLQKAFNLLQKNDRNLRTLPNLPPDLPQSFYDLLQGLLTYRHKKRPSCGEMLESEFVQFHKELEDGVVGLSIEDIAAAASALPIDAKNASGSLSRRMASISLKGSVVRHNLFLGFKKYERSLTALLASMLSQSELSELLDHLKEHIEQKKGALTTEEAAKLVILDEVETASNGGKVVKDQKLQVIPVSELKSILQNEMKNDKVIETMDKIPNGSVYEGFAYHVALLSDFTPDSDAFTTASQGRGRKRLRRSNSFVRRTANTGLLTSSNVSNFSTHSVGARLNGSRNGSKSGSRSVVARGAPSSVHGSTVFGNTRRTQSVVVKPTSQTQTRDSPL